MATHETHNHLQLCTGTGKKWPLRSTPPPHVVNTIMRMSAAFRRKNGRLYVWPPSTEGVLDLCNGAVSEKPHNFLTFVAR